MATNSMVNGCLVACINDVGGGSGTNPQVYIMPAPSGNATTDTLAIQTAFASSFNTIAFYYPGTYLIDAQITWPANKYLVSYIYKGLVSIQASTTSTMAWMFKGTASNIGSTGINFNANRTARNASSGITTCGIFDFGVGSPDGFNFKGCGFFDTGTNCINQSGDSHLYENCHFENLTASGLKFLGSHYSKVLGSYFKNWNSAAAGESFPAIALQINTLDGNKNTDNIIISNNTFVNVSSNGFSIEASGSASFPGNFTKAVITNNTFDAADKEGGSGISGPYENSIFSHNQFLNMQYLHRCGIEIYGNYNTISHNTMRVTSNQNPAGGPSGVISIVGNGVDGFNYGNIIKGNNIYMKSTGVLSAKGIAIYDNIGFIIEGNNFFVDFTGSATTRALISCGDSQGGLRSGQISGNGVYVKSSVTGIVFIRFNAIAGSGLTAGLDYVKHLTIKDNFGYYDGQGISFWEESNSNEYIEYYNNKVFNVGTEVFQFASGSVGCWVESNYLNSVTTVDPGSVSGGGSLSVNVTITGAAVGQHVEFTPPYSLQGLQCTAYVSATNTVTLQFYNSGGGAVDLASGSWKFRLKTIH